MIIGLTSLCFYIPTGTGFSGGWNERSLKQAQENHAANGNQGGYGAPLLRPVKLVFFQISKF